MKRPRSLRNRLVLTVVAVVAGALIVATGVFNVLLWSRLSAAADDDAYARADAELAALTFAHGHLTETQLPDRVPLAGQAWVFVGRRAIETPRVGASLEQVAQQFATATGHQVLRNLPELNARLYLTPIILDKRQSGVVVRQHLARKALAHIANARVGVVVVAISMRPFETTRNLALVASIAWAVALVAVVAIVARWTLGAALRPVSDMTAAADAWSEHETGRRFAGGEPYDELGQLADTLDRLLDRIAASLKREQRFSAELSHELRTPLARLTSEIDLALRRKRSPVEYREALVSLLDEAHYLSRTVDTLVLAAQQESGALRGRADARAAAAETVAACSSLVEERHLTVAIRPEKEVVWLGVEPDVAVRILQPVLQNACCYARAGISLSLSQADNTVAVEVADDGPGVSASEAETIFKPGFRGSAAAGSTDGTAGAGLGLSLARRLARAAGGEVDVVPGPRGLFVVSLPAG